MVTTAFCCPEGSVRNRVIASFYPQVGGLCATCCRTRASSGLVALIVSTSLVVVAVFVVSCTNLMGVFLCILLEFSTSAITCATLQR